MEPAFISPVSFGGSFESPKVGEVLSSELGGMYSVTFFESGEAYFVGFPTFFGGEGPKWRDGVGWFFIWHNS